MKLALTTLIIFSSIFASADLYPYPGNGDTGNYPYPPQQPPPYNQAVCKIEFTGNYYYVSKDGSRFTDLTSNLQQAISQKQQLESSGICGYSAAPGTCQLEFTGNYYYVSRSGTRFSELVSDYRTALQTRDTLYRSRNCDEQTYRPTATCKLEYTGNYYYVSRNGTRFSELVSNLDQATNLRNDLARNYVCQVQYATAPCRLEFTGSYYYTSINSTRSTELVSSLDQALNQQGALYNRGMCSAPVPERCSIEYTGSYYYVARAGTRISALVSDLYSAQSTQRLLYNARACY